MLVGSYTFNDREVFVRAVRGARETRPSVVADQLTRAKSVSDVR